MQDNRHQLSWASDSVCRAWLISKESALDRSQPCACPSSLKHQVGAEKGAGMSERVFHLKPHQDRVGPEMEADAEQPRAGTALTILGCKTAGVLYSTRHCVRQGEVQQGPKL